MSDYLARRAASAATYRVTISRDGTAVVSRLAFGARACRSATRQAVTDCDGTRRELAGAGIADVLTLDGREIDLDNGYRVATRIVSYPLGWMARAAR